MVFFARPDLRRRCTRRGELLARRSRRRWRRWSLLALLRSSGSCCGRSSTSRRSSALHGDDRPGVSDRRRRPRGSCGAQVHGLDIGHPGRPVSRFGGINISQVRPLRGGIAAALGRGRSRSSSARRGSAARCAPSPTTTRRRWRSGIPLQQIWVIVWSVAGFVALVGGHPLGLRATACQFCADLHRR